MLSDLPSLPTVHSGRFSSMEVLSDYGTMSNGSCDEDGSSHSSGDEIELSIGMCPKCRNMFESPVSLQCGHSLCRECSQQVLDKTLSSGRSSRSSNHRPRVRMGLSSYSSLDVRTSISVRKNQLPFKNASSPTFLSPGCPVCNEPPKTVPPVPNYALQKILEALKMRCNYTTQFNAMKPLPMIPRTPSHPSSIKEVNIGIIGGSKTGKTQLRHCQLLNGVFFPSYDGSNMQYMINLVENPDLESVDGIVIVYSVTKESSLNYASKALVSHQLAKKIPCILVGNKTDKIYRRQVDAVDAQSIARQLGCPFREVSARCNDGVSDCFVELLRLIDARV